MFDLIHSLNFEARRAVFHTVMSVSARGGTQVDVADFFVALLQTETVASRLRPTAAVDHLVAKLAPEPAVIPRRPFPSAEGGFLAIPLSENARNVFEAIRVAFQDAAPETVTPREVLLSLLQTDRVLSEVCSEFGVTPNALGE